MSRKPFALAATMFLAGLWLPPQAPAADDRPAIEIMHPWARPTIGGRPGAGYLGIHNNGGEADRLIGARAGDVGEIEIHRVTQENGVVGMERVEAVEVPAPGMVHMGPGSYHLMLIGLEKSLSEGETLPVTLIFEKAGEIEAEFVVANEMPGHSQGHGDHMGAGQHGGGHGQMHEMHHGTPESAEEAGQENNEQGASDN